MNVPSRAKVIEACERNKSLHPASSEMAYNDSIWIKYGTHRTAGQAMLQMYVSEHADPNIVRVPKTYDYFTTTESNPPYTYNIMECGVEIPMDWVFGDFFSRSFKTTGDLQDWINKQLEDDGYEERVELPDERHICHGNLRRHNILKSPQGVTIINWEMSGHYPLMFEEYGAFRNFTRHSTGFERCLHRELFGPGLTENMLPIYKVAIINMVGSCRPRTLQLPDYSYLRSRLMR
ncbi:hypothetical protein B0H67DRAFT_551382 [Lasiosphaeris hirsuta]|uniref:Aminoglycoside phosphotransferase domain-containing protein n=1 Tax=Lasiosphaeris hirsuta TaxID=260670 RepID=A0AA40B1V3_9PEZI|nr:hypothetical protein B0H67DRAFT_551382 [Lasiosphaeris hirsuta]